MKSGVLKRFLNQGFLFVLLSLLIASTSTPQASQPGFNPMVEGSGHVIRYTRQIPPIQSIKISGIADLTLIQSEHSALVTEVEDNIYPLLSIQIEGRILELGQHLASLKTKKPIHYTLYTPAFKELSVQGTATVTTHESFKLESVSIDMSGTSQANLQLIAQQMVAKLSGCASLIAAGQVKDQRIHLNGQAQFQGQRLNGNMALLHITGAGVGRVNVVQNLDVRISGAGKAFYVGSPTIKKTIWDDGRLGPVDNSL